jgi:hypothetical protein
MDDDIHAERRLAEALTNPYQSVSLIGVTTEVMAVCECIGVVLSVAKKIQ